MKVKFLVTLVGPDVVYNAGSVYDLPDDLARALADGLRAVIVDSARDEQPKERPEETTVQRPQRRRGGGAAETTDVQAPEER
ncbi:MAG: hypothetical protein RMJ05_12090 [Thermomicrobium sp.]|nr:hypothetical protein [Thermomicrobium sp.]MDW8007435.1 hypothetical protein [Thermomicrobium sp.]